MEHKLAGDVGNSPLPARLSKLGRYHKFFAAGAISTVVIFLAYFAIRVVLQTPDPPRGDFGVYYRAGQDVINGHDIYNVDVEFDETFKSAPIYALWLALIDWMPLGAARLTIYIVDALCLGVIFATSYRLLYPDGRWLAARGWIAFATSLISARFIGDQFNTGQPTTIWIALCLLSFYWAAQHRPLAAGGALALAVCVKVVPVCFVPHLLLRGRWGLALCCFVGSLALMLLAPSAWFGWDANLQLVGKWGNHLHETLQPEMFRWLSNQSLYANLARFLGPSEYNIQVANLDMWAIGKIWLATSCAAAAGIYGWTILALQSDRTHRRDAAILSLLLIFMTVCNPLAWKHNFIALIFPYFFVLDTMVALPRARWKLVGMLAVAQLFCSHRSSLSGFGVLDVIDLSGGRFWGAIILGAAVIAAYRASNQAVNSDEQTPELPSFRRAA